MQRQRTPELLTDDTFEVKRRYGRHQHILLFNPPVYDAQYWARWSQPAGLLRIATLLKKLKYTVHLIDCMEADDRGNVKKTYHRGLDNQQVIIQRDNISRRIWHFGLKWDEVQKRLKALPAAPKEVWITSGMTYWWESTRDAIRKIREVFPETRIIVGGIYPTLAPEHALENLDADVVFKGELKEASQLPTDLTLYQKTPSYAILTTSRGCPWDCHYCAARTLNGGSTKVRHRDPDEVLAEIREKHQMGIRRFGFYEDNALIQRLNLQHILEGIIQSRLPLQLYAPEGFETRLLTVDLLRLMKQAGFEKIHLPFEALKWDTNEGWNRRHASTSSFDRAVAMAVEAGFKLRTQQINAFVLFGLPDDKLEDILDSVVYVHHTVGSIIPMLFTPVPGTHIYNQHRAYLHGTKGWDLQHINGKFLPFLEYNQQRYPELRASDYLELEALMSVLNDGKFLSRAVDLCDDTTASRGFREALVDLAVQTVPQLPRTRTRVPEILPLVPMR